MTSSNMSPQTDIERAATYTHSIRQAINAAIIATQMAQSRFPKHLGEMSEAERQSSRCVRSALERSGEMQSLNEKLLKDLDQAIWQLCNNEEREPL